MTPVFADTSFYVAVLSPGDSWHARATAVAASLRGPIVTTEFVLLEVANFFCRVGFRPLFTQLLQNLRAAPDVEIVPASIDLFQLGVQLFDTRTGQGLVVDGLHLIPGDVGPRPHRRPDRRSPL